MNGKRILISSVVLTILFLVSNGEGISGTLPDIRARGRLIAGVKTDFPPFGFLDQKGVNKGIDVDIAKIIAKELFGKAEAITFVSVTTENRISFLVSEKVDILLASMTITEERKKVIDFSIPYFISGHLILVRGDSKIIKYQDLASKKVATIRGSTGDKVIGELVPTAKRIQFQLNSEALQALKDHRVEAFVQDDVLIIYLQQKNPGLKISGFRPFRTAPYGLGVRKGDKEWLDFINATLTKMNKNGQYDKLLDKWFGMARGLLFKLEGF
jgi:ABC-type amino acid transport substrate-binding protein